MNRIRGIYDFIILEEEAQGFATLGQGVFLANRIEGEHGVNLYGLADFYVEVFYHIEKNEIKRIRPFRSDRLLEPYLDQIKLDLE